MTSASASGPTQAEADTTREQRRAFGVAAGAHALHDGYTDLIYVMLPIWQTEFGLGYAALGLLRGLFTGTMAGFQIPSGYLAERLGVPLVLACGTALAAAGFCLAGASAGLPMLLVALLIGGLGSSTQHPLASALVARAYQGARSLKALGAYNFAGDIGKMTVPAAASLMLMLLPWRPTLALLGAMGFAAAAMVFLLTPRFAAPLPGLPAQENQVPTASVARGRRGFHILLGIGVLDSATRMGFLTFLPFILIAKGAGLPAVGVALTLVFAGGAAGKLICAFVGARIGVIATVCLTEGLTVLAILALLPLPLLGAMAILPLIGVALNGTSSVLYGSVPELVEPEQRTRAFGIFYTGTIGAGALAPVLYGFVGDLLGVPLSLMIIAAMLLLSLPLALALRPELPRTL
jgi:FSR family fosmidomycin resistance protein-like MFS transporter